MKGLIRKAAAALCCLAGVGGLGCYTYRDLVDPCYPERYNYQARQEVVASYTPQEQNGHVLDQTVWNYDFEPGTDRLTGGGLEHLAYLARRRPQPDPRRLPADGPGRGLRPGPLRRRWPTCARNWTPSASWPIQKFLNAQTAGRRGELPGADPRPVRGGRAGRLGRRRVHCR